MTRRFWLSFHDDEGCMIGACVVDVGDDDLKEAAEIVRERFPNAQPTVYGVAAAVRVAKRLGCNPGGTVACAEMARGSAAFDWYPTGVLMKDDDLAKYGAEGEARS